MKLRFKVNGKKVRVDVAPMKRLLDTLREDLGLTGTKEGCGEGECGACTVLIDGVAVNACLVPTVQVDGASVVTIEGASHDRRIARMQKAFLEHGAAQCGICTPGMIVTAAAMPRACSRKDVREGLSGNLCRCTGYTKIFTAVESALGAKR